MIHLYRCYACLQMEWTRPDCVKKAHELGIHVYIISLYMAFASQVNVELQAHWVLPRWPSHRAPHDWQKYMRPRAKVQGVWVYFIEVTFFIADPVMPHDSSMIVEVIAQCLERVDEICRERNIA